MVHADRGGVMLLRGAIAPSAALAAAALGALLVLALALTCAPAARADEASGHIYLVASSHKLEGRVQIEHECEQGETCLWSAEVSAYAEEEAECPLEIDPEYRVFSGGLKRTTTTARARFQFTPEAPGPQTLCLYVNYPLEEETELLEDVSETATTTAPGSSGGGKSAGGSQSSHDGNGAGAGKGTSGSGGSQSGGSGSQPAGSPSPGSSPSTRRTLASVYRPVRANGSTSLHTHERSGSCWTGSNTAVRRGAWRCKSGNEILDPCFSASAAARSVVCPAGPWSQTAVRLKLTGSLPGKLADKGRPSLKEQPWAIELSDGRRALFSSGASNELEGRRLNYFFGSSSDEGLWGYPYRSSKLWTILVAPFGAQRLDARATIRRAWM